MATRRPYRWLLIGLLAAVSAAAVAIDAATPVWAEHPMAASLIASLITLGLAGLVIDVASEARHRERWNAVREVALLAIQHELTNLERTLASPDGPWARAAMSAPVLAAAAAFDGSGLRYMAERLEQLFALWGDVILGARGPDHDIFEGVRRVLLAAYRLAYVEQVLPTRAAFFAGPADREREWLAEGYPSIERTLTEAKAQAMEAASETQARLRGRLTGNEGGFGGDG